VHRTFNSPPSYETASMCLLKRCPFQSEPKESSNVVVGSRATSDNPLYAPSLAEVQDTLSS
jgi:hypothetical protein